MKSRFPKVWCEACKSMQFAGECPHPRSVGPSSYLFAGGLTPMDADGLDSRSGPRQWMVKTARELFELMRDEELAELGLQRLRL